MSEDMNENQDIQDVMAQLAELAPNPQEQSASSVALRQVQARLAQKPRRPWQQLQGWLFAPAQRTALTAVATLAILIVALSFPTVRAAASDFLGLFRVQKFAAISISPKQLALLEEIAESGLTPGSVTMLEQPDEPRAVATLADAASATSLPTLRTLSALGAPDTIIVTDGGHGQLTLDAESVQAILTAVGVDAAQIPANLDNSVIDIMLGSGVEQEWAGGTYLVQMESPTITYPNALDPTLLGAALLQVLGVAPAEAQRLAAQIDWTATLVLPVPTNFASFTEVTVDGVSGLHLQSLEQESGAVMWQKAGVVYLLAGSGTQGDLLALARSLR